MFRPCFSQIAMMFVVAVVPSPAVFAADEVHQPDVNVQVEPRFEALVQQAIAPVMRTAQVLDEGDVLQLFRRLRPVIQEALGTQGHFAAEVSRKSASAEQPLALVVQVNAGPEFVVKSLSLEFEGGVSASLFEARRARLLQNWTLNQGEVFQQGEWAASKEAVLRDLLAVDFAAARLVDSQALVDPEDHSVTLRAVFDSGPVFTLGALEIQGLKKFRPDLVARYNTIQPGDRYEQERLLAFQAELQGTSYFSSVDVQVELDEQAPEQVPIQVTLAESDSKRLSFGGGYSSNTGFRTEASYQFNNLFDRAYHLTSAVRVEQKRQSAYVDLFLPPSQKGVENSVGVAVDHQAISNLVVDRTSFGAVRQYTDGPTDVRVGLNFQMEDRRAEGVNFGGVQALVPSMSWTRNQLDDRLNPRAGYVAFTQVAGASEALASSQSFVRLYGKLQSFWSPSKQDVWSTRWEWGTVLASDQRDIPQDYLFRSGGSNSVRGFNFMDLGVRDQGVLVGGRRVMVGSAEYTRWVQPQVGVAVFTDFGAVSDHWRTLNPEVALGGGVRYKTPAGAIALDVAKAASQNKPRIHFALGVEF